MRLAIAFAAGVLVTATVPAAAQDYPARDITIIVPWGAGGGADVISRLLAQEMATELGTNVNVVNRTGGVGGSAGMAYAFGQPADGHTLIAFAGVNTTAGVLGGWDQRFDVWQPFIFGGSPVVLSVSADAPWQGLEELVEAARAEPGQIRAGAAAAGTIHHINLLAFERATGTSFNFIPYDGSGPSQNAAVAGEISVIMTSLAEQAQLLRAGRLRPLALMTEEGVTVDGVGDIPAVFDIYPDLGDHLPIQQMIGIAVRADAPDAAQAKLTEAFETAMQSEAVERWAEENFYTIWGATGEEAQEAVAARESLFAWTLHELGATMVDPADLGIPRPGEGG